MLSKETERALALGRACYLRRNTMGRWKCLDYGYTSNFCNVILNQLTYAYSLKLKSHYKMCKGMCAGNHKALATLKLFLGL